MHILGQFVPKTCEHRDTTRTDRFRWLVISAICSRVRLVARDIRRRPNAHQAQFCSRNSSNAGQQNKRTFSRNRSVLVVSRCSQVFGTNCPRKCVGRDHLGQLGSNNYRRRSVSHVSRTATVVRAETLPFLAVGMTTPFGRPQPRKLLSVDGTGARWITNYAAPQP